MSPTLPFVHALKTPRKMRDAPPAQHKTMPNVPRPRHVALSLTRFVIGVGVWSHGQTCPYDSLSFSSHVIHLRPSTNDLYTSYDVLCTFTATEPKTCLSTFVSLNKGRVYCLERYVECTKAARACHAYGKSIQVRLAASSKPPASGLPTALHTQSSSSSVISPSAMPLASSRSRSRAADAESSSALWLLSG